MDAITIIEKPDSVSYEVIRETLQAAHAANFRRGVVLRTTQLSAGELAARVGPRGRCFVAMDGDHVAGTASCRVVERHAWYAKGEVADEILVGVRPEYKGRGVYSRLLAAVEAAAAEAGYRVVVFNTAEKNIEKQRICLKKGFRYVNCFVAPDNDHYSVVMAKWLNGCPFSGARLWIEYHLRRLLVKLRYKPGKIKRFGI